jgi:hypothetical protein
LIIEMWYSSPEGGLPHAAARAAKANETSNLRFIVHLERAL